MQIRPAKAEDLPELLAIIQSAQAYLKAQGVNQWQNGYPQPEVIRGDIDRGDAYLLELDGQIAGYVAVLFGGEPEYDVIEAGEWLGDQPYGAIHRLAILPEARRKGVGQALMEFSHELCLSRGINSVRVDTHPQNRPMRTLLERCGYQECGVVFMKDNSKRVAYSRFI